MKPDTSRWRDHRSYDFFDTLPIEGLAWECLRRHEPYHDFYHGLVKAKLETVPLPGEAERRWGLRFLGQTGFVRSGAKDSLVPICRPSHSVSYARTRRPAAPIAYTTRRAQRGSR
jgi:hypothetical protein